MRVRNYRTTCPVLSLSIERNIKMNYRNRCLRNLKEWGAPLSDWYCVQVEDIAEDGDGMLTICDLCGCEKVRYLHHMTHDEYFEVLAVGCVCAGILEGDELAAKERDQQMKNRAKRRKNFINKEWKTARNGARYLKKNGDNIFINMIGQRFCCTYRGRRVYDYKKKPITNFLTAVYVAFELVEHERKSD